MNRKPTKAVIKQMTDVLKSRYAELYSANGVTVTYAKLGLDVYADVPVLNGDLNVGVACRLIARHDLDDVAKFLTDSTMLDDNERVEARVKLAQSMIAKWVVAEFDDMIRPLVPSGYDLSTSAAAADRPYSPSVRVNPSSPLTVLIDVYVSCPQRRTSESSRMFTGIGFNVYPKQTCPLTTIVNGHAEGAEFEVLVRAAFDKAMGKVRDKFALTVERRK